MPFANTWERDTHYARHGNEFGAADPAEYEKMADMFMSDPMAETAHECFRPRGRDRLRFDFGTYIEGVACVEPEFLKTFFIVRSKVVARHGGEAAYFAWDCGRVEGVDV